MEINTENEKPKIIIELENFYQVRLNEISKNFSITTYMSNHTYSLNEEGDVSGIRMSEMKIKDVSILSQLKKLVFLDLSFNEIDDILALNTLFLLEYCMLGNNKIQEIAPITNSVKLQSLNISNNPIKDIESIKKLSELVHLKAWGIPYTSDFSFLQKLKKLEVLDLAITGLRNVDFAVSPTLMDVDLRFNQINNIAFLLQANEMSSYNLTANLIKNIPRNVAEKYSWFDGRNSKIYLGVNPLEFPPASVLELGPEVTKEYYETSEQYGHAPLSEGRIIVIGDGASGKSSLIEKVLHNSFALGREQTNGIKIDNLYLQHPEDNRSLSFHFWDFGGQEIQHAVHKFFFTEGCLYVLVLDNRKEEEPEYWLQQIESLGGKAPVLVVFNKQDENAAETADRKFLKEKYPNIVGFFNTSCKTGFGIDDFKNSLYSEVVKLGTVSEQFPNNWLAVKKAIEENTSGTQHYLTYEAYQEICKKNNLASEQAQKLLLKYFNTIGIVTWFGEDVHLQYMHVLNPAWITQGVYKVLTAQKTANLFGQIYVSDFKELLQPVNKGDYTYDEKHYGFILAMMKKFDLCYSPDDKKMLIPSAFGKVPKLEYSEYRGEGVRTYILQFKDYMPMALIHRFTAQKMPDVLDSNYWYTGIVIKDRVNTDVTGMVHADREAKRLYIRIKGESKLGLWEHIRRDFATIASSYARIPYDEMVALDEKNEIVVNYEDVVGHIKAQKPVYFHARQQRDYNVGYLMSLFEPKENTTEKIVRGEIVLGDRERNIVPAKVPPVIVQILNNNSPEVNANVQAHVEVKVDVDIDVNVVYQQSSSLTGEINFLLEELGDSNKAIVDALYQAKLFANDAILARNSGEVVQKGWGRKLKKVLETLGTAGEQVKNIKDGGEVVKSILDNISNLAHQFNLHDIISWFQK